MEVFLKKLPCLKRVPVLNSQQSFPPASTFVPFVAIRLRPRQALESFTSTYETDCVPVAARPHGLPVTEERKTSGVPEFCPLSSRLLTVDVAYAPNESAILVVVAASVLVTVELPIIVQPPPVPVKYRLVKGVVVAKIVLPVVVALK